MVILAAPPFYSWNSIGGYLCIWITPTGFFSWFSHYRLYRHMAAMLISLNSPFLSSVPNLRLFRVLSPFVSTLLHEDLFFPKYFYWAKSEISITTVLFSFIMLSSAPAWRAIFIFFLYLVPSRFQWLTTVSHLKVKNKGLHAVDGSRGDSVLIAPSIGFHVQDSSEGRGSGWGKSLLGNLCIIEVSLEFIFCQKFVLLSLSPPHWLFPLPSTLRS